MPNGAGIERFRLRRLSTIAIAVVVAGVAAAALAITIYSQLKTEISEPRENYQWAAYQLQSEYLKLALTAEQAANGRVKLSEIRNRYEIFVSRLLILEKGEAFRPIRESASFKNFLEEMLATVNRIDSDLKAAKPYAALYATIIMHRLKPFEDPLRRLTLDVVRDAAAVQTERQLELLDFMTYLVATLVVIVSISGLLAIVTIKQLGQLQIGRRQLSAALERAEESSRAKSRFLASMSHEMRTPLNAMIGFLREISYRTRTESIRAMAETASSSADMLCILVDDVIDATRLESDKFSFNESLFEPESLMREAATLLASRAEDRGNSIHVETAGLGGRVIKGDRGRLKQILINLLGNAVKFTENGHIELTALLERKPDQKAILRIEVRDNGIGIPDDQHERIFERFAQVGGGGGLGIGLSITRALIERMNGSITVESTLGRGSSFSLAIPVEVSAQPAPKERTHFDEALLTGLRVLVAEDNATNRYVVSLILERQGARFDFAHNGLEAVELAVSRAYDCILMDINMPVMDGLAAMTALQAKLGDKLPPVIALTADALPENLERYLGAGMKATVVKPISETDLLRRIGQVLNRSDIIEHCRDIAPVGGKPVRAADLNLSQRSALGAFLSEMDEESAQW